MGSLLDATGKSQLMETSNQINDVVNAACDVHPRDSTQEEMDDVSTSDDVKRILLSWFEHNLGSDCWTPQQRVLESLSESRGDC